MTDRQLIITKLFETMDVAKRSMHGHMHMVIADHAISRSQLELLFTIHHTQPTTATELASKLQLTAGAISQLVEDLENQQLLRRETDTADRRRQVLRLSEQGEKLITAFDKRRRDVMHQVIKDLSDDELRTWLKIQQKIIDEFQAIHKQLNHEGK